MKKAFPIAACLLFSACIPHPEYRAPVATFTYSFDIERDMPDLFDFTAVYRDEEGRSTRERIDAFPWSRRITARTPFDAHLEVVFAAKDAFPERGTYEVGFEGGVEPADQAVASAPAAPTRRIGSCASR